MQRPLWLPIVTLLLWGLILSGCATAQPAPASDGGDTTQPVADASMDGDRAQTVIFDIDQGTVPDPNLWNPFAPSRRLEHGLMQAMAEPLVILNYETGEYMPWLAASVEANDDSAVWTITLREGITWSDGEAFDADDVIFTVNLATSGGDLQIQSFDGLESVEKVDDLTIQFNLAGPDVRFVDANIATKQGGGFIVVPEHLWANVEDPTTFTFSEPVFTGPYVLESASENEFVYVRNDDWWGAATGFQDLPAPQKLVWTAYGNEEARTAAMGQGELDSLMSVNLGAFLALKQLNSNVTGWTDGLPYTWVDPCARNLEFNHPKAPWDDADMRLAINYAVNRDQIIDIAYEGSTTASMSFLPAFPPLQRYVDAAEAAGLYDTYPIMIHDADQAKAIIESKGYVLNESSGYYEKDGEELATSITSFDDTEFNDTASLIVEQLQAIGINASHSIQPIPEFIENLLGAGFDMYVFFGACGSATEPWQSMNAYNVSHVPEDASEQVGGFYANAPRWNTETAAAYSAIVDQIRDLPLNDAAVEPLFIEAMDLWLSELPAVPLVEAVKLVPFDSTYWTNWPTSENNYVQPATWWQSAHVIIHNLEAVK